MYKIVHKVPKTIQCIIYHQISVTHWRLHLVLLVWNIILLYKTLKLLHKLLQWYPNYASISLVSYLLRYLSLIPSAHFVSTIHCKIIAICGLVCCFLRYFSHAKIQLLIGMYPLSGRSCSNVGDTIDCSDI